MEKIISIIQVVVSILLIIAVLLQNRGTGAGVVFGGGNQVFRAKRGPEKTMHYITVILAVIFFGLGLFSALFANN